MDYDYTSFDYSEKDLEKGNKSTGLSSADYKKLDAGYQVTGKDGSTYETEYTSGFASYYDDK